MPSANNQFQVNRNCPLVGAMYIGHVTASSVVITICPQFFIFSPKDERVWICPFMATWVTRSIFAQNIDNIVCVCVLTLGNVPPGRVPVLACARYRNVLFHCH